MAARPAPLTPDLASMIMSSFSMSPACPGAHALGPHTVSQLSSEKMVRSRMHWTACSTNAAGSEHTTDLHQGEATALDSKGRNVWMQQCHSCIGDLHGSLCTMMLLGQSPHAKGCSSSRGVTGLVTAHQLLRLMSRHELMASGALPQAGAQEGAARMLGSIQGWPPAVQT